jgi:hypothetical protein
MVLRIAFDRHELSLKRLLVLAHERSDGCPFPLIAVDIDKHTTRLLAKFEHVRVSTDYRLLLKIDVCRLRIRRKRT